MWSYCSLAEEEKGAVETFKILGLAENIYLLYKYGWRRHKSRIWTAKI